MIGYGPKSLFLSVSPSKLSAKQVIAVYRASDNDFSASLDCLLAGPTFSSIVGMLNDQFEHCPTIKVKVDPDDIWQNVEGDLTQLE